jgi:uncharacterized protein YjiS (DUF1127 family)
MTVTTSGLGTVRNSTQKFGLMGRMKIYIARSKAERQLLQMDDRMLADIGVMRGEISSVVWGN